MRGRGPGTVRPEGRLVPGLVKSKFGAKEAADPVGEEESSECGVKSSQVTYQKKQPTQWARRRTRRSSRNMPSAESTSA
jgi:hypothetical protein